MAQNRAKGDEFINKEPLQEAGEQKAAAESKQKEEDFGYSLYPERGSSKFKQGSIGESLFTFKHKCLIMLQVATDTSPYAKLLLGAMKSSGCAVYKDRHFSCEDCDGTVSGGFDAATSQIVLCQNNIHQQAHMNRVVTHELIHAFDHCRARVDWFSSFRHLACSEACVRGRALRSILAVRKVSREEAELVVDEVFDSCFHDHAPFGRIPHSKKDAKFAYRDYENRDRYYANL
ncbi:mitochondrial inner membrane protease ATP23 homolog isoform X2 [Sinocyclocheilus rhinocerous]|uniref:mitochondrial inner membrane protease ATP23 homolog isoform X2 n=1 Tax=Sinocyclocheilus rhinocerous TaxID=307959 RepID=UPI0007B8AB79|nr:PREDICTED: mitochondrial inner membrane protease ATP23 homolog isoform X2 [Sinocyclocheilus rhinocerous]